MPQDRWYGVRKSQVYLAADGGRYGHITVSDPYSNGGVAEVLVVPFDRTGDFAQEARAIACWKLAQVRYYLVAELP